MSTHTTETYHLTGTMIEQYHKHHRGRRRQKSHNQVDNNSTNLNNDQCFVTTFPNSYLNQSPVKNSSSSFLHKPITPLAHLLHMTKLTTSLRLLFYTAIILTVSNQLYIQTTQAQNFLTPNTQSYLIVGHNLENFRISEITPVNSVVYTLKALDRLNENRKFSYHMTGDTFQVDELTGEVRLVKPLDRERQAQIVVILSVFDISDLRNDAPVESKRRTIIVEDIDDSWPTFATNKYSLTSATTTTSGIAASGNNNLQNQQQRAGYQVEISEQAVIGTLVVGDILVSDADEGSNAELVFECRPKQSSQAACETFSVESRRLSPGKYSISVRTKLNLDYESLQSYMLLLIARGKRPSPLKGLPLETEAMINIQLINIQDEGPVFANAPYSLSIPENIKPSTKLLSIIVQDGDAAPQRNLSMMVVPTNSVLSRYFQVEKDAELSSTWYLMTSNDTIDREDPMISDLGNMFTISLLAAELDESGLEPIADSSEISAALNDPNYSRGTVKRENVTIVVMDQADSRPIFIQASTGLPLPMRDMSVLVVNISESISTGASVPNLDLAVIDLDQGMNSRFNLSLIDDETGPQASSVFSLEPRIVYGKAEIVLTVLNDTLLDYENPSLRSYRFNLVASKAPDLIQMLELQVNIQDANDNGPEFDRDQYVLELAEGALPNTVVGIIQARDRDSGSYGHIEYMLYGPGASRFKLAPVEGKIIVNDCGYLQCIDYETQPSYSFTYEAKDGGGNVKNVSVIINVIDINDHAPKFTEMIYKRELLSDNLSSKQNYISPQLIVRAKDGDGPTQGRNNVTYRIRNSNLTNLDVDPNSGLVYFSQPLNLDNYILQANGGPTDEHNGGGDHIEMLPSSSNNNNLLSQASSAASNTGGEQQRRIVFEAEVVAEDNGRPSLNSTAKIILIVKGNRDGAPQFKQHLYHAYVHENHPINKPFFQVQAIDPDDKDSQLRYSLGYDLNDLIQINPVSGELSFKSKIDYDDFKEMGGSYNVTVYATDNSRPHPLRDTAVVSILVQDVNDKVPQFREKEYKATLIQGHTKRGDSVLTVSAIDLDKSAKLNYSLVSDKIYVHDRNGLQLNLDDLANSTSVGYLAQMNMRERQQLIGQLKRLFAIDKRTGVIELRSEPDYSFAASITIQVRVQDLNQEIYSSSQTTSDVGSTTTSESSQQQLEQVDVANCTFFLQTHLNKSPIFAPPWSIEHRYYNLSILEEQPIGTSIFSFLATDSRTGQRVELFEKVFESDPKDFFRVERSSGIVYINRRIDFEELPNVVSPQQASNGAAASTSGMKRLQVSVKAITEDEYFSVATLYIRIIDLNDNSPRFKPLPSSTSSSSSTSVASSANYSVSISEATTYPEEIFQVNAEDRDSNEFGQVYYSLSTHSAELFTIDPKRGIISVRKGVKLDRDSEATHSLIVTASNCNETSGAASGFGVGPATAPSGDNNQLIASSASTSAAALLMQGCKKSSVVVSVNLLDENDNDPVFKNLNQRGEIEALVSETSSPGSDITQVEATDLDEGASGQVGYELVSVDEQINGLIKVDPTRGYISVAQSLAGLGRATPYKLTIRAYDHGKPVARQAYATLLLTVSDVVYNDGVPKFVRPRMDEIVLLSENVGPNSLVYQVQAVDPDEGTNGTIMYKFAQPSHMFEIDPFTGIIKTSHNSRYGFDREQVPSYSLIVLAQDLGTPRKEAHQVLTIRITDVNDNEPYFERGIDDPPLVLFVEEEVPANTLVGTIQAIDRDIDQNALIGYEIIDGNQKNLFRLEFDQAAASEQQQQQPPQVQTSNYSASQQQANLIMANNPCKIYSTGRLDREFRDSYTLTIKASSASKLRNPFMHSIRDPLGSRNPFNQYNATDLTKIRVTIKLVDINDNWPVFVQDNAKSVVDSSAEIYSQLLVFKAVDSDTPNMDLHYSILDVFYYSDSKFKYQSLEESTNSGSGNFYNAYNNGHMQQQQHHHHQPGAALQSVSNVFDIDSRSGILRNSVSLRPYTDGYFEVYVKADSSPPSVAYNQIQSSADPGESNREDEESGNAYDAARFSSSGSKTRGTSAKKINSLGACVGENINNNNNGNSSSGSYADITNCYVSVTRAIVFVTHQRETFKFVFNKTKLNDRLDEFKSKIQSALEEMMFEPAQPQASMDSSASSRDNNLVMGNSLLPSPRADKIYLNTFNTDFYEREDGSLDFSTLTSCSQLVKFDDRSSSLNPASSSASLVTSQESTTLNHQLPSTSSASSSSASSGGAGGGVAGNSLVPNQVINYEEVLQLLKTLNQTQLRQQKASLFNQYGLVSIERCLPNRILYRMSLSERFSIYFAIAIALIGSLLALIVSKMRKSYEKNLKLLQRSKYQYMSPYSTLPPQLGNPLGSQQQLRPHHMSLGTLAGSTNYIAPSYGSQLEFDRAAYDTWQL